MKKTEDEILDSIRYECISCGYSPSLLTWRDAHYNHFGLGGELDISLAEDPVEMIEGIRMDCPECGEGVYLSDGGIV